MTCMRRPTPAGVTFAVVAVNASTTSSGPAAYAFETMNTAMAAIAHAVIRLKTKRLKLADIVVRPQVGDRLLETRVAPRRRRGDPRTRLQGRDLCEVVARHGDFEAHVLLAVLGRQELDRQRHEMVVGRTAVDDAAHAGSGVDP